MKEQSTIQTKHTSIWLFGILTTSSRTEAYQPCCVSQPVFSLMQNRLQLIFHTLPAYPSFLAATILPMQKQLEHTIYACPFPLEKNIPSYVSYPFRFRRLSNMLFLQLMLLPVQNRFQLAFHA